MYIFQNYFSKLIQIFIEYIDFIEYKSLNKFQIYVLICFIEQNLRFKKVFQFEIS
jgi:hypothetical protein